MATETLSGSDYDLRYVTDEYGHRRMRTEQEIEVIKLDKQFKEFLEHSTLSSEDEQRLRRISADYAVANASLPLKNDDHVDYSEMRRSILDYVSSDLPDATEDSPFGLRRMLGGVHGVTIVADGHPLSMKELELAYIFIEPSTEVLDRAVKDAAYFYVPSAEEQPSRVNPEASTPAEQVSTVLSQPQVDMSRTWVDDILFEEYEPIFDEPHTLKDELRPITGQLKVLGSKVLALVMHSRASDDQGLERRAA